MKKLIILKNLDYNEKKIILSITIVAMFIFLFLYFILNLNGFSKIKSDFISEKTKQLAKNISQSVYSKNYLLAEKIIKKSYLLDFINFIELKDKNNNLIFLTTDQRNISIKYSDNIIIEPIYYDNNLMGKLIFYIPNEFLKKLRLNIINLSILLVLILISLLIIIGLIRSKTYRNNIENEKKQIEHLISHLSKLFSHDFRKPFNLLKMLLSNIKKSKNSSLEINDLNNMIIIEIEKNIARTDSLIHDIMDLGIEAKTNTEIIDLRIIIENIVKSPTLYNNLNKFNLNLKMLHSGKVDIDILKLNKAISTLITYTTKNSKNEENIWIKTGNIKIKNKLFIYLKIGTQIRYIPKNEIYLIFNLFYLNEKKGNSGLELAICKKIIESQNGFIKCNSSKLKGTEFTIILPQYNC